MTIDRDAKASRFDRELLKGNTATVVLAILDEGPLHGYQIAKEMARRSDDALRLGHGVLYPILGLLLSPILAALAMSFSSVTVISNANRLKRFRLQEVSA